MGGGRRPTVALALAVGIAAPCGHCLGLSDFLHNTQTGHTWTACPQGQGCRAAAGGGAAAAADGRGAAAAGAGCGLGRLTGVAAAGCRPVFMHISCHCHTSSSHVGKQRESERRRRGGAAHAAAAAACGLPRPSRRPQVVPPDSAAMGQYLSAPVVHQDKVSGEHPALGPYSVVSMQGWRRSQVGSLGAAAGPACSRRGAQAAPAAARQLAGGRLPALQEDAHIAEHISDECHIFGVFDGHGGPEVARFCSKRMPDELQRQPGFAEGRYEESLKQVGRRQGPRSTAQLRRTCRAGGAAAATSGPPAAYALLNLLRCSTAWMS